MKKRSIWKTPTELPHSPECMTGKYIGHNLVWGTHNPEWLTWGSSPSQKLSSGGGEPIHGIGFQGGIYGQIVKICLQIPSCTAIQTWGVTRKCSWLGWTTHKTKAAGLVFDRQYHPKAAYKAFEEVLNKRPSQQN